MKGKYKRLVVNRIVITVVLILLQIVWFVFMLEKLARYSSWITTAFTALSIAIVLYIIGKDDNSAYKIGWIVLIMTLPLFGGLLYLFLGDKKPSRNMRRKLNAQHDVFKDTLIQEGELQDRLGKIHGRAAGTFQYVRRVSDFPAYENTDVTYYPSGEEMFVDMLEELRQAKHFIFLEYFIIHDGRMWREILQVLEEKVKEGVDVRLIYDDMGCVTTLPHRYYKELQKKGIKCAAFNPVRPVLNIILNNRDHRKILVIDGHTGFTGGINLADEYINEDVRFGHWKDTGVMLHGEGVWNLTVMFLQMWAVITHTRSHLPAYGPYIYHPEEFENDGFVQPYGDSPLDNEIVGENVYLNIINQAKRYVYICTPYLIIDNEMMTALCLASKKGVDVRIVTPGIPDKKMVFLLTQSYYEQLLEAGVRIFEYTPGFIHSKSFVCDDEIASVGTINLDYRSLYLHFECAVWMYRSRAVMQVKEDMEDTFPKCREICMKFCRSRNIFVRMAQSILRLFAPML